MFPWATTAAGAEAAAAAAHLLPAGPLAVEVGSAAANPVQCVRVGIRANKKQEGALPYLSTRPVPRQTSQPIDPFPLQIKQLPASSILQKKLRHHDD